MKTDLYQTLTNRIVTELEHGVRPWLNVLKNDKHAICTAAAHAQRTI